MVTIARSVLLGFTTCLRVKYGDYCQVSTVRFHYMSQSEVW